MKKQNKYWLVQIVGWSLYTLLNLYIAFFEHDTLSFKIIIINILLSAGGLLITHSFRKYIISNRWFTIETTALITQSLLANVILALCFCIWHFLIVNIFIYDGANTASWLVLFKPFMSAYLILLSWTLLYFTWSYIEKNRSRIIDQLQLQNDMQELELKSLRSNLQPHFIFNSLNSIRALINEDPQAARNAVTKLSKILRTSISTKDNSITLHAELQLVENYLHLEKIRFDDRLQYVFDIDYETRTCLLPPMLLQNMVENAVKHGISLREKGGTIWLSSQIIEDKIVISIKNEGKLNEQNKLQGTGFGMSSSKKRLNYLYPQGAEINISEINGSVVVEIYIPNNIKPYEN